MTGNVVGLPYLRALLQPRDCEVFVALFVSSRAGEAVRFSGCRELACGTEREVQVPVRELFRAAHVAGVSSVVLAHNHPSGNPTPSADDVLLTAKLADAGEAIGVAVIDHVIIGAGDSYFSFAECDFFKR